MSRTLPRLVLHGTAALALAAGGLAFAGAATANPAGTGLVISEVYGAGGNSGAVYNADFVELYNPTNAALSVAGDYIHYRSAAGGSGGAPFALQGSVPAGGDYLIQMSVAGSTGAALPTPDAVATPAFTVAAAGGQIFLLSQSAPITGNGNQAGAAGVIDMVGATGSASFEGAPTASAATATSSLNRTGADTDSNLADFALAAPSPTPTGGGTPPPTEFTGTIAQIQGTNTDTSPHVGDLATTTGVVTAAYPTGGPNGFVIQTDGTGGATDDTPGASDAIFVYGSAATSAVHVGEYVKVTGKMSEFSGLTELAPSGASTVSDLDAPPLGGVTPLATAYPRTDAGREAHESELLAPTDQFTVTDNYSTNQYGEIGLVTGDHQLVQPTDVANPRTDPGIVAGIAADNAARAVTLDDGASWNYLTTYKNTPVPWLSTDNPVRIGSTATLQSPVILDYRNSVSKFQPTGQVTDSGASVATFGDTRTPNLAPQPVGGNLELGTFNVLNYFNTTGRDWIASGHTCSFYNDRNGDPVTDNTCSGNGPRGAAESSGGTGLTDPTADVERQRAKEVQAINKSGTDIVSLEEIENSVALGIADRDDALKTLVDALNADPAKPHPWAFVPSPDAADLPLTADQDVIRTAFIYNPDKVATVGTSKVLSDQSGPGQPFENAREPLAQEFKRKGAMDADGFDVIVNHFKSKGSGVDDGSGQGNANPDRVAQAHALVDFANVFKASSGTNRVFLVGDFNSYTQEDPMLVLYGAGYVNQASDHPNDSTYEFGGMTGSLDHVLANTSAANLVTGRDVWQIDAEESVGFEYSRYNYNATQLYQPNQFRASDHNPEIVGLEAPFTKADSSVSVTASPAQLQKKKGTSTVTATVTSSGTAAATGTVEFYVNGAKAATATLADGVASTTVGPFANPGTVNVEVRYLGDDSTNPSSATTTITVTNGNPK